MPKKFTILSSLAAVSISTLGMIAPTFADTVATYQISEIAPIHSEFASSMEESCGTYVNSTSYRNCFNAVAAELRETYGGLYDSLYQLDYNGRMVVTGLNPMAGTLRFYVDETRAYRGAAFNFESLVIFWADSTASPNPSRDEDAGWAFVDSYLETGEIPQGYHVLYGSKQGDDNWLTPNTEMRVFYDQENNSASDVALNNRYKFIHVYGYDTEGNKHIENNYLSSCLNSSLLSGNECRLVYNYNGSSASPKYVVGEATAEDAIIIELKQALAEKADLEARLAATEAEIERATENYQNALNTISELNSRIYELEANATNYENMILEYETAISEYENSISKYKRVISEYETAILEYKSVISENEAKLASLESDLSSTKSQLSSAEAELSAYKAKVSSLETELDSYKTKSASLETELESAKASLSKTQNKLLKTKEELAESQAAAEEAKKNAVKSEAVLKEMSTALETAQKAAEEATIRANEAIIRAETLASSTNTVTIYKTIERIIKENTAGTSNVETTATDTILENNGQDSEVLEQNPEEYVELPMAGSKEESVFPWWLIVFIFTGIAMILWWFVPATKKQKK